MPVCEGCGVNYANRGFANHIRTTRQPACRAIFDEQNSYMPGTGISQSSVPQSPGNYTPQGVDPDPGNPTPFEGDYYGSHYNKDDFDFTGNNSESDSEEDDLQHTATGNAWEPEPDPLGPGDENYMDDSDSSGQQGSQAAEARRVAQDRLRSSSLTIESFGGKAGATIRQEADSNSGYHTYKSSDSSNPWAPFKSKLDWEIARWSKLRGPGSTATTELLGINGVCAVQTEFNPA